MEDRFHIDIEDALTLPWCGIERTTQDAIYWWVEGKSGVYREQSDLTAPGSFKAMYATLASYGDVVFEVVYLVKEVP